MARLIVMVVLFLLSLLNFFRAPLSLLWYVSILTTEFCWIFISIVIFLLLLGFGNEKYFVPANIFGLISLLFFCLPLLQAYRIGHSLEKKFDEVFDTGSTGENPFLFTRMISGINSKQIVPRVFTYRESDSMQLDYYASTLNGSHPCVIVIHGGSWAGGDKEQLPELNSYLAQLGYNVFSINYRLAPLYKYPSPVEDVESVIQFLHANAEKMNLDTSNIVLVGRSAGGQIALDAAYKLNNPSIKGVISYYGPTDMIWGYLHPANPLVLDSKKIMEDYLGGTYQQLPEQYARSSATELANAGSVPTLLIQGKNDPLVAYEHCSRLDKKLNEHGVRHFILRMPWATHGCDFTLNGPAGQLSTYVTARFLENVFHSSGKN